MTKNLLSMPSGQADSALLADFVEIQTFFRADRNYSRQDLIQTLNKFNEPSTDEFITDARNEAAADRAFNELALRKDHLGVHEALYPFEIESGELLRRKSIASKSKSNLYLFMLFATRENMRDNAKVNAGGRVLDATSLFENLAMHVARSYLGAQQKRIIIGKVIGTSRMRVDPTNPDNLLNPNFGDTIRELCHDMGEGGTYYPKYPKPSAKDDRIDLVAWHSFSDGREGKVMLFGQAKTGTSWQSMIPGLNPTTFCERWMERMPPVKPIKAHFLCDRITTDKLEGNLYFLQQDGGLIFDRCRVLEYSDLAPVDLISDCRLWFKHLLKNKQLNQ